MSTTKSPQQTKQDEAPTARQCTLIEPPRGWHLVSWREFLAYRELLYYFMWRDIAVRYKQTVLGTAWAVVQPLATTIVWSIVFGYFIGLNREVGGEPYPLFLLAGLLPWNIFSGGLAGASNSVLAHAGIITKIYFPRILVPISSVAVNIVNFIVACAMLLGVLAWYRIMPGPQILLLPLAAFLVLLTTLAIGIGLSATMVVYRDVRFLSPFFLQIMLYLTPVIYPVTIIPERIQWLLFLNPLTGQVELFRWCLYGKPFLISSLVISVALTFTMLLVSSLIFRRLEGRFADIV